MAEPMKGDKERRRHIVIVVELIHESHQPWFEGWIRTSESTYVDLGGLGEN
jgi:hypothetical protein